MWPNPKETADLVTFTEEIFNRKLHFLCSVLLKKFVYPLHLRKMTFENSTNNKHITIIIMMY